MLLISRMIVNDSLHESYLHLLKETDSFNLFKDLGLIDWFISYCNSQSDSQF